LSDPDQWELSHPKVFLKVVVQTFFPRRLTVE
jgi:hypothetical protein